MYHVIEYLSTSPQPPSVVARTNRRTNRTSKILYVVGTRLGSIILVQENGRVTRKANHSNSMTFVAIRLGQPIQYLSPLMLDPTVTLTIANSATAVLMYCHEIVDVVWSISRAILLLGKTTLVFSNSTRPAGDYRHRCSSEECCTKPCVCLSAPTFDLSSGDRLVLKHCYFNVRISSERHEIYMSKWQFKTYVEFVPASIQYGLDHPLIRFVEALP
ncbi:hypothetical protein RDWZM_003599 [Blomia tropicalis]|uniref:Uncharacterized protein n=1 Tax=Blomia tropicalis TaxID=40697 RepID=A0A9Q0RSP5_BLOTA|nr:hypothetical protein RDWZM_003599 [Blomia tropicalis]